jgi:CRP-like cAMP-binding protein
MIAVSSIQGQPAGKTSSTVMSGAGVQPLPAGLGFGLSPQDMQRVNAARPLLRTLQAGESLYFQGDDCGKIYLLLNGWAFRHQSLEDGRRQILDFALPGGAFGLPGTGVMSDSLEALTPCTFSVFSRDNLCRLLQEVPILALRFVELLADAQTRAFEHLTSVGRRSARERVASLLIELINRSPQSEEQRSGISLPLMQPHIADALGLASETVCRALSAMRRDGVVVLRGHRLEVLDIDQLACEAGVGNENVAPLKLISRVGRPSVTTQQSRVQPREAVAA